MSKNGLRNKSANRVMHRKKSIIEYENLVIGVLLLITGYLFYAVIRQFDPLGMITLNIKIVEGLDNNVLNMLTYSLPTFFHVVALSFLSLSFKGIDKQLCFRIVSFWVIYNIAYEYLQSHTVLGLKLISGTGDPMDMIFAIVGGVCVYHFHKQKLKKGDASLLVTNATKKQKNLVFSCMVLFGAGLSLGCDGRIDADPIYMSYSELRSPFVVEQNRPISEAGKTRVVESFLLVNELNEGIHVFDNTNPESPIYYGFMVIPGNLDMELKDGFLFADSYIDLITLDLNDLNSISIVQRIENNFPYYPHQKIKKYGYVTLYNLDPSKGVVVDIIERSPEK